MKPKASEVKAAEKRYMSLLLQYGPNNLATIRAEIKYREMERVRRIA